ncbi:MAG: GNAT family N-acetyltransferase [Bauldia sp.]|uniref:GNAT family N-acetyltransferase n=1 Tax=Bauldia sp. TaxID=2575872 RepID=UPI001DC89738|nr:GNAT family N-acetyltransferase [Bauldia sp.]MCB1497718.1 GNAT family N-acetyltransferase [Bauldia sp.]
MTGLEIRPASRDDLAIMTDWAAAEGWNPGHHDADAFHPADPEGFLIGWKNGKPVSCISVVGYDDTYGFLGFYIVDPDHRGQGHGLATWNAGMARLGDRTIGLDGVVDQQANYAKSGFVLAERNIRFSGVPSVGAPGDHPIVVLDGMSPSLADYDAAMMPARRADFLRHWINPDHRHTLGYVRDGRIRGYGTIRPCREGYKIGPLFADTPEIAEALFNRLVATSNGEPVSIDVPEPNTAGVALATRHGLTPSFETARMYRGTPPSVPLNDIYGITSFELG